MRKLATGFVGLLAVGAAALAVASLPGAGGGADSGADAAREAPQGPGARAAELAMRAVRARLANPGAAEFREVATFRFGPEDERAVCGRVAPGDGAPETGFVVRVILSGQPEPAGAGRARSRLTMTILEDGPGLPFASPNAWRRLCRDKPPEGTAETLHVSIPSAPPALRGASDLTGASAPPSPAAGGGWGPAGRVVVQSPANVRAGPSGAAVVLRTAPRGHVLSVFDRAPGGWVRVGEAEPWGWVHSTLLAEGGP
jgi:hypothetical protein